MVFIIVFLILAIGGRWACSKICPLGIIEELIFKIPFPKKYFSLPYEKRLRKIKYFIFFILLVVIPVFLLPNKNELGMVFLFLKILGFTTVFILSLFIYRPFCKYFCPFGVVLGVFNKISPFRYQTESNCNHCGLCGHYCKMGLVPYENPNHMECIRCGACLKGCPRKALRKKNIR